jgi:hypothetical protein
MPPVGSSVEAIFSLRFFRSDADPLFGRSGEMSVYPLSRRHKADESRETDRQSHYARLRSEGLTAREAYTKLRERHLNPTAGEIATVPAFDHDTPMLSGETICDFDVSVLRVAADAYSAVSQGRIYTSQGNDLRIARMMADWGMLSDVQHSPVGFQISRSYIEFAQKARETLRLKHLLDNDFAPCGSSDRWQAASNNFLRACLVLIDSFRLSREKRVRRRLEQAYAVTAIEMWTAAVFASPANRERFWQRHHALRTAEAVSEEHYDTVMQGFIAEARQRQ